MILMSIDILWVKRFATLFTVKVSQGQYNASKSCTEKNQNICSVVVKFWDKSLALPINTWVSGAQMKVPIPDPHTAIPVASDLCFSKYIETQTIAGRYIKPKPKPVQTPV